MHRLAAKSCDARSTLASEFAAGTFKGERTKPQKYVYTALHAARNAAL